MEDKTMYFAYGSNLSVGGMAFRCPDARKVGRAALSGWRLAFRGVADIEEFDGETVEGGLWLVSRRDLIALDRYEGAPHLYRREYVTVDGPDGPVQALTYVMTRRYRGDRGLPAPSYLQTIKTGYEDFGIADTGPVYDAVNRAADACFASGATEFRPVGKKRLMAVTPRVDAEVEVETMSPATRRLWALERGGEPEECLASD